MKIIMNIEPYIFFCMNKNNYFEGTFNKKNMRVFRVILIILSLGVFGLMNIIFVPTFLYLFLAILIGFFYHQMFINYRSKNIQQLKPIKNLEMHKQMIADMIERQHKMLNISYVLMGLLIIILATVMFTPIKVIIIIIPSLVSIIFEYLDYNTQENIDCLRKLLQKAYQR